jgi:hypothetical protein
VCEDKIFSTFYDLGFFHCFSEEILDSGLRITWWHSAKSRLSLAAGQELTEAYKHIKKCNVHYIWCHELQVLYMHMADVSYMEDL